MKKVLIFTVFLIAATVTSFAQSGRRIAVKPTPSVPVQGSTEAIKENDESQGYSESKPSSRRASQTTPSLRTAPKPDAKKPTSTNNEVILGDSDDEVLKVETNLITIPVSVFDRNGLYIPDLRKESFKIFEDGVEQPIEYFATTDSPVTVVLLLDTSPSTEYKIEEIQNAAIAFINQLQPRDTVIVIEFDANVHVLAEATTDRSQTIRGIRRADFGGGTSLYDAVHFSIMKRLNKIEGRKAIVLFTDGVDTTSTKTNYDESISEAEEADATIFPIYYNTFADNQRRNGGVIFSPFPQMGGRGVTRQEYALGRQYLADLADSTGGRVFNADDSPGGLTRTFESIAEELRRQYSIGYIPQETGVPGQRKSIRVRVNRPKLVVRARDSYIVGQTDKRKTTK